MLRCDPYGFLCALGLALLSSARPLEAQGTFRNLDFQLAQIPPSTPAGSLVAANLAFPFWTTYVDGDQLSAVIYNSRTAGSAAVGFLDSHSPVGPIIPGYNTAVLQAGIFGQGSASASIAQTGMVPVDAMSLLFTASRPIGQGWSVTVGNQDIPVFEVSPVAQNLFLYQGDVSAFAGRAEELRFTALVGGQEMDFGDVRFSPTAIPEPSQVALAAVGAVAIGIRRVRNRRKTNL